MPDEETIAIYPPMRFCIGDCRDKLCKIVCDPRRDQGGDVRALYVSVSHEASVDGVRSLDTELETLFRTLPLSSPLATAGLQYSPLLGSGGDEIKRYAPCMNVMLSKECTTVLRWMRQTSDKSPRFMWCNCTELAKGVRVHCEVTVNCLSVNHMKGTVRPMAMAHLVLADTKHWSSEMVDCPFDYTPFQTVKIHATEEQIAARVFSKATG